MAKPEMLHDYSGNGNHAVKGEPQVTPYEALLIANGFFVSLSAVSAHLTAAGLDDLVDMAFEAWDAVHLALKQAKAKGEVSDG